MKKNLGFSACVAAVVVSSSPVFAGVLEKSGTIFNKIDAISLVDSTDLPTTEAVQQQQQQQVSFKIERKEQQCEEHIGSTIV